MSNFAKVYSDAFGVIKGVTLDIEAFPDAPSGTVYTLTFDKTTNFDAVSSLVGNNPTHPPDDHFTTNSGQRLWNSGGEITINAQASGELTSADMDSDYVDGLAAVPSMRTLGATSVKAAAGNDARFSNPGLAQGRLTLESGVPISTTDQLTKTTLYYTPYQGNRISLYDGTAWQTVSFSQLSLVLTGLLTSGKNYDVFVYSTSSPSLDMVEWTNDTTRATALATQDGVLVLTGDTGKKYVGTIRASATNQTEDSEKKRFVWNYYNQVRRKLKVTDTTNSWTYASTTFRQANANSANQVEVVVGQTPDHAIELSVQCLCGNQAVTGLVSIGVNSTTARTQDRAAGGTVSVFSYANAQLVHSPAVGYSYYAWIEAGDSATSKTYYGDNGVTDSYQGGLLGTFFC